MGLFHKTKDQARTLLLRQIAEAVRNAGGTLYLKQPLVMWATEIGEEVPVKVRRIEAVGDKDGPQGFNTGNGYCDYHFDDESLQELKKNIYIR